jgi:amino-acid N-acetyltransferase
VTGASRIRDATDSDFAQVLGLLARNALPTADVTRARPDFVVARRGEAIVGAAGLEVHGALGLLRSLVVDESRRGAGLGRALVGRVERMATNRGIAELVPLTETARDFFARLGYVDAAREQLPERMRESAQFRVLFPRSARCMRKRLGSRAGRGRRNPR